MSQVRDDKRCRTEYDGASESNGYEGITKQNCRHDSAGWSPRRQGTTSRSRLASRPEAKHSECDAEIKLRSEVKPRPSTLSANDDSCQAQNAVFDFSTIPRTWRIIPAGPKNLLRVLSGNCRLQIPESKCRRGQLPPLGTSLQIMSPAVRRG